MPALMATPPALPLSHARRAQSRSAATPAGLSLPAAIVVLVLVATSLRPGIVSMGPVLGQLRGEFHLSNAQASLLTAIPTLLMGLLAIPTPWLSRRFGRRRVVLSALVVLSLATLLRAAAASPGWLFVSTAGVGAGIAIAGALMAGFVKAHHPGRAALLMGVYAASLGLGSTVTAALTGPVAALSGGWRAATAIWAVPGLVAIATWLHASRSEDAQPRPERARPDPANRHPARLLRGWLVALYFAANNFLFFGLLAWLVPMSQSFGASAAQAGWMLAGFTTVFMLANPMPALWRTGPDRRWQIAGFAGAFLLGIGWLIAAPHAQGWLPIALLALGIGGSFSLGMTLPLDNAADADHANSWTSFVLAVGYGLGALGPLTLGLVSDRTHSFVPALWILAAAGVLKLVLAPFLYREQRRSSAQGAQHLREARSVACRRHPDLC
ncbi:CP family cyanate transporter-like MFS transporter [Sphaerotilus hippei]|uniref:CP family cyanate transporter-like MFS transporter n=1 Tax=Sphaerotilus hippei TaxID=744406 RepID=A0A318H1X3_9BURK|nr:MFS transporter [Sphaerotilus hippei]PXW95440.1 CP family cyanate transporter-like MFS transporter [Sphaerotilus hippei]